eukprot:TRINITY_DN4514_c0_g1_i1.p1 TRINITY_DN4514_c0_g1~~TRINITY_DN4514_c0_g1_i1.p1  ORF type:complete len:532 (-),score=102.68 TRINITY_DN4514_c0_g1_i1:28-1623(-)
MMEEVLAIGKRVYHDIQGLISTKDLLEHTSVLASDEFGGRYMNTPGETLTINYLTKQFSSIDGILPGFTDEYTQSVMLEVHQPKVTSNVTVTDLIDNTVADLEHSVDVTSRCHNSSIGSKVDLIGNDVVWVGFGIDSPKFNWNDFDGINVAGKTILCLVNDPGFYHDDDSFFSGKIMTYYGRWTYKFEEAARQGAKAVYIIHSDDAAGYGWNIVSQGKNNTQLSSDRCSVEGWITNDTAVSLFKLCGLDFENEKALASTTSFRPYTLPLKFSVHIENNFSTLQSHNFVAHLPGNESSDEAIVYSAHYDHFGIDEEGEIYSGARDNAIGVAGLISLAKALSLIPLEQRKRSIVFLIPTAEEAGLLGSEYYAREPIFPMEKTVGCINFDLINIFGPTSDITFYGYGNSQMDFLAYEGAKIQGRTVEPDPFAANGMMYRSDQFSLAKRGVPFLFPNMGFQHTEKGNDYLVDISKKWTAECYHQPTDKVVADPNSIWCWDLRGARQDVQIALFVGCTLCVSDFKPQWLPDAEFSR